MNSLSNSKCFPVSVGFIGLAMTFFRVILSVFSIPLILEQDSKGLLSVIILVIMTFDYFDGKLFRRSLLNERPVWRKTRRIVDSCGDRICIQAVCIPLVIVQPSFLVPYIIICFKEFLSSVTCIQEFVRGFIIYPSKMARLSTVCVGIEVIAFLLCNIYITFAVSLILLFCGVVSFHEYRKNSVLCKKGVLVEGEDYELM